MSYNRIDWDIHKGIPELEPEEAVSTDFYDEQEVEPTQDVLSRYGYNDATPIDTLMANQAMGFEYAGAMGG